MRSVKVGSVKVGRHNTEAEGQPRKRLAKLQRKKRGKAKSRLFNQLLMRWRWE